MSRSIRIYNTVNTNQLRRIIDSVFTVSWGDGNTSQIAMPTIDDVNLPYADHTYTSDGEYQIEITVVSPWKVERLKRTINIPLLDNDYPTDLGTLCFEVPYSDPTWYQNQNYLQDYRELTGATENSEISFLAIGKSRIDEFQLYGSSQYSGVTIFTTGSGYVVTGYTIDGLFYMDYEDGYTHITGNTSSYYQDEIYQGMITRDEHLIGFIDTPQISSDIFVERGKQSVMERNLRLGELDSTGEMDIYGSGFFKIRKQ